MDTLARAVPSTHPSVWIEPYPERVLAGPRVTRGGSAWRCARVQARSSALQLGVPSREVPRVEARDHLACARGEGAAGNALADDRKPPETRVDERPARPRPRVVVGTGHAVAALGAQPLPGVVHECPQRRRVTGQNISDHTRASGSRDAHAGHGDAAQEATVTPDPICV